ncbi:hypothetical protein FMUND_10969 [Fusarium mundagurra]|uniref:Uncharacterized protein n=1 Tax=Fusarium mundagurra TaxID=1567541 RepID=A0A8H5YA88_9HYPO|nr:hypothetical protein FMUND_10969 [Fusarium mundagurra]
MKVILLLTIAATAASATFHGHPDRIEYTGQITSVKDINSQKAQVEKAIADDCTNIGGHKSYGEWSPDNYFEFFCECAHGNTLDNGDYSINNGANWWNGEASYADVQYPCRT